ncbi:hypothetical protein [Halobacillus sp. A5]|uniref:hypothetical protein n=1 Tax=Halobacillus sp. A5 TaxID=2880263 RepID=UPI0020A6541F|nr:hypothetical protein [Halobacillus sp. A5]MCP3027064.1 hypothetical protein [Halobacillus sp. A5]
MDFAFNFLIYIKYKATKACAVTGEILDDNRLFGSNIWLSPEGLRILTEELEKELHK